MERIKSANGYTIYRATERDEKRYRVNAGEYYVYFSSDVREFGLANSYPEYEGLETLAEALELCNDSNYAVAKEIAERWTTAATYHEIDTVLVLLETLTPDEAAEVYEAALEAWTDEELAEIERAEAEAAEARYYETAPRWYAVQLGPWDNRLDTIYFNLDEAQAMCRGLVDLNPEIQIAVVVYPFRGQEYKRVGTITEF